MTELYPKPLSPHAAFNRYFLRSDEFHKIPSNGPSILGRYDSTALRLTPVSDLGEYTNLPTKQLRSGLLEGIQGLRNFGVEVPTVRSALISSMYGDYLATTMPYFDKANELVAPYIGEIHAKMTDYFNHKIRFGGICYADYAYEQFVVPELTKTPTLVDVDPDFKIVEPNSRIAKFGLATIQQEKKLFTI